MKLPIVDFKNLVSINRIFEVNPGGQGEYVYTAYFFGALVVASIIIWFIESLITKSFRKFYVRLATMMATIGCLGLVLVLVRFQEIPYIGSRFAMYALIVFMLIWFGEIIIYRYTQLPKELQKKQEKEKFKKYLPKNYKGI